MNPIAKSLLVISAATLVGGGAITAAYFSSQITSANNTITTGKLEVTLNDSNNGSLTASNMYPGSFVETAAAVRNTGTIKMNPSLSLGDASDPDGLASKLILQVWTTGKLWYNGPLTGAPGYTSNKIILDTINPGDSTFVAIRLTLDESATTGGTYGVKVNITGFQWNDPAGATTASTPDAGLVVNDWSYNVCGVRPTSTYYSGDETVWKVQIVPFAATGTQPDGSCKVP